MVAHAGTVAGVALEGATLREDLDDNAALYGKKLENRTIVTKGARAPGAAARMPLDELASVRNVLEDLNRPSPAIGAAEWLRTASP